MRSDVAPTSPKRVDHIAIQCIKGIKESPTSKNPKLPLSVCRSPHGSPTTTALITSIEK